MRKWLVSCAMVCGMLLFFVVAPGVALADGEATAPAPTPTQAVNDSCHSSFLGLPHWYEYLEVGPKGSDPCAITGPMNGDEFDWKAAIPRVAAAVIAILLRVAALLAVGFTIYGGFRYIISQGEPDATKKAKGTIVAASVGLVIAMFASVVVGFLGGVLWQ